MKTFKQFIESALQKDFTHLSIQDRMAQGRDIGEPFIKNQLKNYGLFIKDVPPRMDINQKIDGMLDGEPVQIKLRRSTKLGRNDISYEVCRNHDNNIRLQSQLMDIHQQGRDFKGKVKHYFIMNQEETEIYHVLASDLKQAVFEAINELNKSRDLGYLKYPFRASNGVELRPTVDRDPQSFTPNKVMAFIPVENVILKSYPIKS